MFQRTFPLNNRPAIKIIGSHFGENCTKIDLAIAQRTEAPGTIDPALIPAIDALSTSGVKFRVLDVEHLDAIFANAAIVEIIEALQHRMRRIRAAFGT